MEAFPALLAFSTGHWSQRPVTRSLDVFLERRPNKRLSKQSIRRWFETPSRSLWCYCYCHFDSSSLISRWLAMKWNRWEKWIKIYGLFSCPSELNNFAFWVLNLIGTISQTSLQIQKTRYSGYDFHVRPYYVAKMHLWAFAWSFTLLLLMPIGLKAIVYV